MPKQRIRLIACVIGVLALLLTLFLFRLQEHLHDSIFPLDDREIKPMSTDQVVLYWVSKDGWRATIYMGLKERTYLYLSTTPHQDPESSNQSPFLPLGDQQIKQINKLLSILPSSPDESFDDDNDYDHVYHLAFYDQNELRRYHFSKDYPPSEIPELLKLLGLEDYCK